jgi:hypothetical protein
MSGRKITAGVAGLVVAVAGVTGVATAQKAPKAPSKATVKEKTGFTIKPNRYVQDNLRWDKDVYRIKKGGTLTLVGNVVNEGPHTFSVVKKKQLPQNGKQANNCKVCQAVAKAHGFDPNDENSQPKFLYVENGTGQATPPNVDKPGDSALIALKKGDKTKVKVTAKAGKTIYFMCVIHPWMEAKVKVLK